MWRISYFNPHAREGRDYLGRYLERVDEISIHTPAKGVTTAAGTLIYLQNISIHTPAKGVTCYERETAEHVVFQSTRPRRA